MEPEVKGNGWRSWRSCCFLALFCLRNRSIKGIISKTAAMLSTTNLEARKKEMKIRNKGRTVSSFRQGTWAQRNYIDFPKYPKLTLTSFRLHHRLHFAFESISFFLFLPDPALFTLPFFVRGMLIQVPNGSSLHFYHTSTLILFVSVLGIRFERGAVAVAVNDNGLFLAKNMVRMSSQMYPLDRLGFGEGDVRVFRFHFLLFARFVTLEVKGGHRCRVAWGAAFWLHACISRFPMVVTIRGRLLMVDVKIALEWAIQGTWSKGGEGGCDSKRDPWELRGDGE